MNVLLIELRKEKRTGVIPVLLAVGVLGAAYAFVNFLVRKDTLLNLPLAPMDVLLTQLYGVIMILNLFGTQFAAGPDGCSADPALRCNYDPEPVRHRGCHLHDLQHGV